MTHVAHQTEPVPVDRICVKKQSESRVSSRKARIETDSETEDTVSQVTSNVVLLEKKTGDFEYITEVYDNGREELITRSDIIKSKVISEYGNDVEPLKMVAISDNTKNIRTWLNGYIWYPYSNSSGLVSLSFQSP